TIRGVFPNSRKLSDAGPEPTFIPALQRRLRVLKGIQYARLLVRLVPDRIDRSRAFAVGVAAQSRSAPPSTFAKNPQPHRLQSEKTNGPLQRAHAKEKEVIGALLQRRNGRPILARIGCPVVHTRRKIPQHRLPSADHACEIPIQFDLVSS